MCVVVVFPPPHKNSYNGCFCGALTVCVCISCHWLPGEIKWKLGAHKFFFIKKPRNVLFFYYKTNVQNPNLEVNHPSQRNNKGCGSSTKFKYSSKRSARHPEPHCLVAERFLRGEIKPASVFHTRIETLKAPDFYQKIIFCGKRWGRLWWIVLKGRLKVEGCLGFFKIGFFLVAKTKGSSNHPQKKHVKTTKQPFRNILSKQNTISLAGSSHAGLIFWVFTIAQKLVWLSFFC